MAFGTNGKIVGTETEISYHPEILDTSANAVAKSKVFTLSQDMIIGPTIGRIKGYGAVGAGDLHLNVGSVSNLILPSGDSLSSNYFTINAGGGAIGFVTKHIGIRGDLRYLRAFGLDFVPVTQEPYDLVVAPGAMESPLLAPLWALLHSDRFQAAVTELGGYSTKEMGRRIR